jgi:hypothetical protein
VSIGAKSRLQHPDYNERRPRQGRWCFGKTRMQTFLDAIPMARAQMIAA